MIKWSMVWIQVSAAKIGFIQFHWLLYILTSHFCFQNNIWVDQPTNGCLFQQKEPFIIFSTENRFTDSKREVDARGHTTTRKMVCPHREVLGVKKGWPNIVQLGGGGHCCGCEDSVSGLWLHPGTLFAHLILGGQRQPNFNCHNGYKNPFVVNEWTSLIV
jgi:hypothetical protein